MTGVLGFFQPNGLKLLLALTLLIPVYFVLMLVTGFPHYNTLLLAVITIFISYAAACVLDETVQSRTIKILIASVAAVISIILGYILVRSMTMVCDPVHDPGQIVCDPVHTPAPPTAAPTVIHTVRPTTTTPMIFDPVHTPEPTTTAPTVIHTIRPTKTTPMICDPVHLPSGCGQTCRDAISNAAGTTDIVAQKLDECLQNCYR
jgi:hypothetical protein